MHRTNIVLSGNISDVPPSDENHCIAILDKVRPQVEEKLGKHFESWTAIQMKSQVYAGTCYYIKVDAGSECVHVKVHEDIEGQHELKACKASMHKDDMLADFE